MTFGGLSWEGAPFRKHTKVLIKPKLYFLHLRVHKGQMCLGLMPAFVYHQYVMTIHGVFCCPYTVGVDIFRAPTDYVGGGDEPTGEWLSSQWCRVQRKKNPEWAQSDLKVFGSHGEVFEIRLKNRYSAHMCFFFKRSSQRADWTPEIWKERWSDCSVCRDWEDTGKREIWGNGGCQMSNHFSQLLSPDLNDLLLWKQHRAYVRVKILCSVITVGI